MLTIYDTFKLKAYKGLEAVIGLQWPQILGFKEVSAIFNALIDFSSMIELNISTMQ